MYSALLVTHKYHLQPLIVHTYMYVWGACFGNTQRLSHLESQWKVYHKPIGRGGGAWGVHAPTPFAQRSTLSILKLTCVVWLLHNSVF